MASRAGEIFRELVDVADNPQATLDFLFTNPVVFSESWWPEFQNIIDGLTGRSRTLAEIALQISRRMAAALAQGTTEYTFGLGPVDRLVRRVRSSEINFDYALKLAATPEVYCRLSPLYVRAFAVETVSETTHGDWRLGVQMHRLLLAAIDSRHDALQTDQASMEGVAALHWAALVSRAVWHVPDGRLFCDAVKRLQSLPADAGQPWFAPYESWHALGSLHLDPYSYERGGDFEHEMTLWRERLYQEYGDSLGRWKTEIQMPEPLDAIIAALDYFGRAAGARTGEPRGLSLKGRLQAAFWRKVAGGPSPAPEALDWGREALALLPSPGYDGPRTEIASMMQRISRETKVVAGSAAPGAESPSDDAKGTEDIDTPRLAEQLLATPLDDLIRAKGEVGAANLLMQVASMAARRRDVPLRLWEKARGLLKTREESLREQYFLLGGAVLCQAFAHQEYVKENDRPPTSRALAAVNQFQAGNWTPQELGATLLGIATNSSTRNEEEKGVEILQVLERLSPAFAAQYREVIDCVVANLTFSTAVKYVSGNDADKATGKYFEAADRYLRMGFVDHSMQAISRAVSLAPASQFAQEICCGALYTLAPELEFQGGGAATRAIQSACRDLAAFLLAGPPRPDWLEILLLTAKGLRFSAALTEGRTAPWLDSPQSSRLLERIAAATRRLPECPTRRVDPIVLLCGYAADSETRPGDSPEVLLHNLHVRYDAELYRELSHRPAGRQTWIPSLAHLQEVLTAETVLLQYYIGKTLDGSTGLYVMLVTREDAIPLAIRLTDLPSSQHLGVEIEGQVLTLGYFGGIASEVRSLVQEEPGPAEAVEEAVESLAQHSTTLLPSNVGIVLRALRESGKTHLCIVPHGALHFFPFHLLPYADGLLADSWAVTYLPSLMMFSPERQPCPPRDCEISSLGLDFEENNPYGLDPLKGAEKEAGEIAAIFNTAACNGATATESAFTAALVHARRVHLSTHGVHAVSAPSFQRVYLAPDQGNDGVFYAYEVLRYDLRGLDLVTLSACETSLGRIDDADNLRGLPANLLIAGARTVVGTLWPVEASAASTFFRSLYSLLQQGESKVVAFRDAQWHTRCLHPQFRDWGAFYYIGNW